MAEEPYLGKIKFPVIEGNDFMRSIIRRVLSAFEVDEVRDAGVNEYVVKPFSAKTLLGRIMAVTDRPRPYIRTNNFFGPDRRRKRTGANKRRRMDEDMTQDAVNELMNREKGS